MPPVSLDKFADNSKMDNAGSARTTVLFEQSKSPQFTVTAGYRNLHRRLKSAWRVDVNSDEMDTEIPSDCRVLVIAGPQQPYNQAEFESIRRFISSGGSVLCLLGEGGETKYSTNINFLLEEYGVMVNADNVIRTVFYKYFHPKEALVSNGVLNRSIAVAAGKTAAGSPLDDDENHAQALTFVYPFGATLNVNRLATVVLSTGSVCFPIHRPIAAFHTSKGGRGGKLAVLGSCHMFTDQYLDREENGKVLDVVMQFLTDADFKLNVIDAEDPEISDYHPIPDHIQMSEQIKSCLQEGEGEMHTRDLTKLFDSSLFAMDLALLPNVLRSYEQLSVKHEPLGLINPQFETPQPGLTAAVFPPNFRDVPPPQLELFDLDEVFSSEKVRLAQVTNKCTSDDDLDYFIREAGDILAVTKRLPSEQRTPAHIVEFVCTQIAEFKKLNQEGPPASGYVEQDGAQMQAFNDEQQFSDIEDADDLDDLDED